MAGEQALAARFARAVNERDLPPDADPMALARFLSVVTEGNAVHAAAGTQRSQLQESAEIAPQAFTAAAYPVHAAR